MSGNSELLLRKAKHLVSSPFGYRIHPVTKEPQGHNGVDYATYNENVPCFAPEDGKVLRISMDQYGGKFVYVGFPSLKRVGLYYHLETITVKVNQAVRKDDQIGTVGSTGRSTGIHLHFSWIEWNDKALRYYEADYEDFEKYQFPEEDEEVQKQKITVEMNGKNTQVESILYENKNWIPVRDLADAQTDDDLTVNWDPVRKKVVIKSK